MPFSQADLGDDVAGRAGLESGDRNDAGVERIDISRSDRLQGEHDLRPGDDRIDALMRHRRMAALAFDRDRDLVGGGHQRPFAQHEGSDRQQRPIVHAVDLLDAELVHQPVLDHRPRARAALFGGLEDDDGIAGEVAGLSQAPRRAEQHRRMPVVAAGVHFARILGAIGEVGRLLDRQRVHVRAQPDRARARALGAADDADDAGSADRRLDLVAAESSEAVGDISSRALDVVQELRVLMDVATPGLSVLNEVLDGGGDRHRKRAPCKFH